ncbi:hypothetical protein ACFU7D_04235 [Nocardioides sp. NPDC057577]|uniref:hypothetical protein n=1 Tax=Nocardioides sp. NPDC057577 TaxID=3346171 RepID=UPI00366BCE30
MPQRPSIIGPVIAAVVGLAGLIGGFVRVERTRWVFGGDEVSATDTCTSFDTSGEMLESGPCSAMAELVTKTESMSMWLSFCGAVVLVIAVVLIVRRLNDY